MTTFLRTIAQKVFHPKATGAFLSHWSADSIRVTAANLLHHQDFSDTYIQMRLRWKSTVFLDYLRNTMDTAAAHTKALHMPENNLPAITNKCDKTTIPSAFPLVVNSPLSTPLLRHYDNEGIEDVMNATATSTASFVTPKRSSSPQFNPSPPGIFSSCSYLCGQLL